MFQLLSVVRVVILRIWIYNEKFWLLQRDSQKLLLKILKTWFVLMLRRWVLNISVDIYHIEYARVDLEDKA